MTSASNRIALDRRTFLVGAVATGLFSACGSGGDGDGSDDPLDAGEPIEPDTYSVIQRFPSDVITPGEVRLPFSLSTARAQFVTDGPTELRGRLTDLDGNATGDVLVAVRRDVTPAPYYAFRTTIDEPGFYNIVIEGGPETGASFQVTDPAQVVIPVPGDPLPGFTTPTVDDPGGVDPICTRSPACDFHSITLDDALAAGTPVAYFVGTPALCATGSCTPALEALLDVAPDYADRFSIVHAEVYTDPTGITIAPAVESLGISFEPAIFLTDADGVVTERLDGLWDTTELRERLEANSS